MKIIEEKLSNGNTIQYHQLDNGTCYNVKTPVGVVEELEKSRLSGVRIRVFYGDQETGRCWMEENNTIGTVGQSTGRIKIPLLIKTKRSFGGGAILDSDIVKITIKIHGVVIPQIVYEHPNFHMPKMEIVKSHVPRYEWGVNIEYCREANFTKRSCAERYIAFMRGERNSK